MPSSMGNSNVQPLTVENLMTSLERGNNDDDDADDDDDEDAGVWRLGDRSMSMDEFLRASTKVEQNLKLLNDGLERLRAGSPESRDLEGIILRRTQSATTMTREQRASAEGVAHVVASPETLTHVYSLRHRADAGAEQKTTAAPSADGSTSTNTSSGNSNDNSNNAQAQEATGQTAVERETTAPATDTKAAATATDAAVVAANLRADELEIDNATLKKTLAEVEKALMLKSTEVDKMESRHSELIKELAASQTLIKQTLQQIWELKANQVGSRAAGDRPRIDL